MRMPCDEALLRSAGERSACQEEAKKWVLTATILGSSLAFIDSTVVNVALPALQASFHASVVDVQWVVESYGLFLGALILAGGSFGDRFGRRRMFVIGVAIFAVASAACAVSGSIRQLIIARSIQGLGAALLVPGSLALIAASFDDKSRGQAIGTWSGFTAITTAIGPVLGGWMVEHASWRSVFLINLPLAVVVIAICIWRIPESRRASAAGIDWVGALLATIGLGALVWGLIESVNLGWRNPLIFGTSIAGVGILAAFVFLEARTDEPMVPLSLFASRNFTGANLLTLFLYSAVGIFFFLFPLNLIQVQEYSPTITGAAILPFILLMFFLSRWSGGLVTRYGPRVPLIVGPLIAALGFALLTRPSVGDSYWGEFFPGIMVLGFGMAVTVAPLTTVVMTSVDGDRVGAASGINNAVARVAGVLAIAVLGIVMVRSFSSRLETAISKFSLPAAPAQELQANVSKLADSKVPAGLDADTAAGVRDSIAGAFVFGFRIVMLICAGLSLASAAVAWRMVTKAG